MDVRVGLWRKLSNKELMLLNCGVGEDSWESLGLQGDLTSPFWWRSALGFLWRECCWSWNSSTLATSCEELTHWKRLWCWEGLGAGGEGDDRGWNGWRASLPRWTWVWVNSGSWWWTGRPGVLRFMGSRRVGHNWATELTECWFYSSSQPLIQSFDFSCFCHVCALPSLNLNSGWVSLIFEKEMLLKYLWSMFFGNKGSAKFCNGMLYPVWRSQPSCLLGVLVPAVFSLSWDSWPKSYTAGLFLLWWWAHEGNLRQCLPKGGSRAAWVRIMWDVYQILRIISLISLQHNPMNHSLWRLQSKNQHLNKLFSTLRLE